MKREYYLDKIIYFPENNDYRYSQDFHTKKGIPHDVPFKIETYNELVRRVTLKGPNHGSKPYGNGVIHIDEEILEEVLQSNINRKLIDDVVDQYAENRSSFLDALIEKFIKENNVTVNDIEIVEQKQDNEIAWFVRKRKDI